MRRGSNSLLIILAVFLVLVAGIGAYLYSTGGLVSSGQTALPTDIPAPVQVVHASIDLAAGTVISVTEGLLELQDIPASDFNSDPERYFTSIDELQGQKAATLLTGGQPVLKTQIRQAGLADLIPRALPGQEPVRAFPIQVNSLTGMADLIQPNDYVDIMASFNLNVETIRPGIISSTLPSGIGVGAGSTITTTGNILKETSEGSTKILLQDIQVLDVIREAAPIGTPTPEGQPAPQAEQLATPQPIQVPQNASGQSLTPGNWIIVVAVTNQEAEVLSFALSRGIGISTLLRPTGDHTTQRTVGATLRILNESFGMPLGSTFPSLLNPVSQFPAEPLPRYGPTIAVPTPTAVPQ